jgi:8-amino-7-oxononanoate synthase
MNRSATHRSGAPSIPARREFFKQSAAALFLMSLPDGRAFAGEDGPQGIAPSGYGDMFIMESAPGPITIINGKPRIYFGGTGYFALQGNPEVIEAGITAFRKYGVHPATSRSGFGHTPLTIEIEKAIARYFDTEDSLHFVSGYLDNLFLVQAHRDKIDVVFIDETAHYSIKDAVYSALKPVIMFRHRDPEDLVAKLRANLKPGQIPLVMTDGIFPTYGVIAPVPEYVKAIEPYNGILCLDDSHSVGVLGPNGRGTYEHFGIKSDRCFFAGTMSKAFGGHGGFIPGSKAFIDHIKATCGAYSGATPSPTPGVAASIKGMEIVLREPERRERLRRNVAMAKTGLKKMGFDMNDNPVPIVTWALKSPEDTKRVHKEMFDRGVAVALSKYVGAPPGGVLRASIFSEHTPEQINRLLDEMKRLA